MWYCYENTFDLENPLKGLQGPPQCQELYFENHYLEQCPAQSCWLVQLLSHVRLFTTPWTVAHQAPLSLGFPKQEYWRIPKQEYFSGGFSRPRDQTCISFFADGFSTTESPGKPQHRVGTTQVCAQCLLHRTPFVRCSWGYKSRKDLILLLESHLSDAFWVSDSRIFAFNLTLFLQKHSQGSRPGISPASPLLTSPEDYDICGCFSQRLATCVRNRER